MRSFIKTKFIIIFIVIELLFWACFCFWWSRGFTKVNAPTERLIIALDAGHGGVDGGVTGALTGVRESDLNLEVAVIIKKKLQERGATVVMTRKDKNGLYGIHQKGFKLRDMEKRKEIITSASPDLVISIHMNKFSDCKRSGPQVFYQKGKENGAILAKSIQSVLNDFTKNSHNALSGDFYICQCVSAPSVIVECGFLSNPTEERKLCDRAYQEKLSEEIVKGIFFYLYSI